MWPFLSAFVFGSVVAGCCHIKVIHAQCMDNAGLASVCMGEECLPCVTISVRVQAEADVRTVHLSTGMALICYSETHQNLYGKTSKWRLKGRFPQVTCCG